MARPCAKARQPVVPDVLAALGVSALTTAAVCVYPMMVTVAKRALGGSGVSVASVATGFPAGLMPLDLRHAVGQGADEIDVVITRAHALRAEWTALYDELRAMRKVCGAARMKVILVTGDLKSLEIIAMQAGVDWIKTSTGKEPVNATLPVSLVMCRTNQPRNDSLPVADLHQIFAVSGLPGGVINVMAGDGRDHGPDLAAHGEVAAIWRVGGPATCLTALKCAAGVDLKPVWVPADCDWSRIEAQGEVFLQHAVWIKTLWLPFGALPAVAGLLVC